MADIVFIVRGDKDDAASSKYRVLQYLPYLEKNHVTYEVILPPQRKIVHFHMWVPFFLKLFFFGLRAKTIFVQKDIFMLSAWRLFKMLGKEIVYDFDDAIFHDDGTKNTPVFYFSFGRKNIKETVIRMIETSDLTIVASRYLAEFSRQYSKNTVIIPMSLNLAEYSKKENCAGGGKIAIGWIGSPQTVRYLEMIGEAMARLHDKYNERIEFTIVTNGDIGLRAFPYRKIAWNPSSEINDIRSFDIGLAPLPSDPFTLGKSSFKLLQYMAVGLPSVCSDVGFNSEIIQDGKNGFLVKNIDEWVTRLSMLVDNPGLRSEMGDAAQRTIKDTFTYDINASRFLETLRNIGSPSR